MLKLVVLAVFLYLAYDIYKDVKKYQNIKREEEKLEEERLALEKEKLTSDVLDLKSETSEIRKQNYRSNDNFGDDSTDNYESFETNGYNGNDE